MKSITDNNVLQLYEYFKQNNIKYATQNEIVILYKYLKNGCENSILNFIHNELNKDFCQLHCIFVWLYMGPYQEIVLENR